jgi:hypothetical protein
VRTAITITNLGAHLARDINVAFDAPKCFILPQNTYSFPQIGKTFSNSFSKESL